MKQYIEIINQEDLEQNWTDPLVPHMSWNFEQTKLEECFTDIDGKLYASYELFTLDKETTFNTINGSYTIPAGTYGYYPNIPSLSSLPK